MKCVENVVRDIYNNSMIPFQLYIDEYGVYSTPLFDNSQNCIEKRFEFKYTKCCIKVNAAFSNTIDLLIFCLQNKLEEVFIRKQNIISSLLSGKEVSREVINTVWPSIQDDFYLINIYLENNLDGVFSILKEGYLDSDIEVIIYNNNLLMIGNLDEPAEHIQSIKETINDNYAGKCYICYCTVAGISDLTRCYKDTEYNLGLAIKYNINESIFNEKRLILEGIIDSVSEETKSNLYKNFNEGFSQLDNEMIKTIEIFFRCGLNLSEAAKELYIHRNTLIYRLDKIQKYTTYDIREFNSAVLFKIVFFLWKEKKQFNT